MPASQGAYEQLLEQYRQEGDDFILNIVMWDGNLVHHDPGEK